MMCHDDPDSPESRLIGAVVAFLVRTLHPGS